MIKFILLGIIQGLTEFLPVSSSAHLVFAEKLLKVGMDNIAFFVVLHLGSVAALIIYFFREILGVFCDRKVFLSLSIATVITAAIGFAGKDFFEQAFASVPATAVELIISGCILLAACRFLQGKKDKPNIVDGITLGIAQAVSIIPGISRSGTTISALLFRGLNKEKAFALAFLVGIPAILGAAILEAKEIGFALKGQGVNFIAGFMASFITGLFALFLLKVVIRRAKLHYFGYYCIAAGILTLIFLR